MAIIKCKMCGAPLDVNENTTVCACEYCGTTQTLPASKNDVLTNLFNRANNLRMKNEFDKAQEIYEKIVNQNSGESEAYWGIVLCKYGIEYVEDPATLKKIPTCHRTQLESVMTDVDYLSAIENADSEQKTVYEAEAREIDRLQKDILNIVHKEKPFDVFICYKETDENGKRTRDSVIANDIYHQLTQEGFKVFYAAITLEDKIGQEYEPYIFAALNSAKVMLVVGSKAEYFEAVWVKNEWSRFLKLMKNDRSKILIPCYRDIDAYDLPEDFSHLQAQDMTKIGFINDLVRGIRKVIVKDEPKAVKQETVIVNNTANTNTAPLLKRAFIFLEDGEFERADDFAEQVLNQEPECAEAYLVKLMAELSVKSRDSLKDVSEPFDDMNNYAKAYKYGSDELKAELDEDNSFIRERNENERRENIYQEACRMLNGTSKQQECINAKCSFESIIGYKDSVDKIRECDQKAEICRKDEIYNSGCTLMANNDVEDYENAINIFRQVIEWKDSAQKITECESQIEKIRKFEEKERIAKEIADKKQKKITAIVAGAIALIVVGIIVTTNVVIQNSNYKNGISLMESGSYNEAIEVFDKLGDYKDSINKSKETRYLREIEHRELFSQISAGISNTVGVKSDGTVVAVGNDDDGQCDVSKWSDIVSVSSSSRYTVGLKSDGTVVAVGNNDDGQCEVSEWNDIVEISACGTHTIGLKSDGTVVATGNRGYGQCYVSEWNDIVSVSAGGRHTAGLKSDGTVVAVGDNKYGQCDVSEWKGIVEISAGGHHTAGLKSDGTVVVVGSNVYGEHDVSEWKDIVAVAAGNYHSIGLKADGTVVAVGNNAYGQCDVSEWKDIVAVVAGENHTIGLKSDGTAVAVGSNSDGQCDISEWTDICTVKK